MTRATLLTIAFLLALAAPASAKLTVGIGEQNAAFFADERWKALKAPHVRYVLSWDALKRNGWEEAQLDNYMWWARQVRAKVMITFGASRRAGRSGTSHGSRPATTTRCAPRAPSARCQRRRCSTRRT